MIDYIRFWWTYYRTYLSYSRVHAVYAVLIIRPLWAISAAWRFRRARSLVHRG